MTVRKARKPEHVLKRLIDTVARREVLITPHLEKALLTLGSGAWPSRWEIAVDNSEKLWDGYFHPSSHASMPALMLYYLFHPDYHTEKEKLFVEDVMAMMLGSAAHAMVQSVLCHIGFTTPEECETPFTNEERHVSGKVDVRKVTLPDGTTFPVEIKTAGWLPERPWDNHLDQVQVYMDNGCDEPQEIGCILYCEKQTPHRFREFVIHRDEARLEQIYEKWRSVREAVDLSDPSLLVDCCSSNSKEHRACPARYVCRIGEPQHVAVGRSI